MLVNHLQYFGVHLHGLFVVSHDAATTKIAVLRPSNPDWIFIHIIKFFAPGKRAGGGEG